MSYRWVRISNGQRAYGGPVTRAEYRKLSQVLASIWKRLEKEKSRKTKSGKLP